MVILIVCKFKEYNSYYIVVQYIYNKDYDGVELRNIDTTPGVKIIQYTGKYNITNVQNDVEINNITIIPLRYWTATMIYFKHELTKKVNNMLINTLNANHIINQRHFEYRIWNSVFTIPYTRDSKKLLSEDYSVQQIIKKIFTEYKDSLIYWHNIKWPIKIQYYNKKPIIMFTTFYNQTMFTDVITNVKMLSK